MGVQVRWRVWAGWLAFGIWATAAAQTPIEVNTEHAPEPPASQRIPLDDIRRFVTLFNTVRDGYVDVVDDDALMSSAIRGLLRDLDPHSSYLEKSAAEDLAEHTSGAYGGIGIEVVYLPDGWIRIIAPIDDTPATRAGLRAGDTIIAVDAEPLTSGMASGRELLRGEPGTKVVLSVLREGHDEPLDMTVTREIIKIVSVRSRMLEPGYGYIRLSAFQLDSAKDFRAAVAALHEEDERLQGLVIDLRSNPGGVLTAAVEIADDLLESGVIVSTRGRGQAMDSIFTATPGDVLNGAPVVLIVDAGSASAAEVLAGALGDHGRARIVGSRTFGKGSVQTVLSLSNGDAVKLTTARYYTPGGRSIQARGIDPDVVLRPDGAEEDAPGRIRVAEAALPGHLRGELEDGGGAGEVLDGAGPVAAALAELKRMVEVAMRDRAAHGPDAQ